MLCVFGTGSVGWPATETNSAARSAHLLADGSGPYWAVGSYYTPSEGHTYITHFEEVAPLAEISGSIALKDGNKPTWVVSTQAVGGGAAHVLNIDAAGVRPVVQLAAAMETYTFGNCSSYPGSGARALFFFFFFFFVCVCVCGHEGLTAVFFVVLVTSHVLPRAR